MSQKFCMKCQRTLDEGQFYTYKNKEKVEQCKKCMTMHIENGDPTTFLWLLEKMDVPYIEREWNTLYQRALEKQGPYKMTGMSVFGKYLSKMKLKQWSDYSWEDTERLKAEADRKTQEAHAAGDARDYDAEALKELFDKGEISEAEFLTLSAEQPLRPAEDPSGFRYPEAHPFTKVNLPDPAADLEEDDLKLLAMKWGRFYDAGQWIYLENFYENMLNSFDIKSASREDTVMKLAKTSLKMNEAIDAGDVDTFLKLSRVYDTLTKSGKFSEAQNKEQDKGFVNSIGELVAECEKKGGFIPRFDFSANPDVVDKTIQDMNKYTYNLVTKELGLGQLIEDAIKKIEIERQMEKDEEEEGVEDIFDEDFIESIVLEDADIEEFYDEVAIQKEFDLQGDEDGA